MLILRLASRLALWGLAWLLLTLAWMGSVSATAYDARVPWGLAGPGIAWGAGTLLAGLAARVAPGRFRRLDATRHGLSLVVLALCAHALSHAGPHMSIRVLREEIPPLFAPLFSLLAGTAPLLLAAAVERSPGRLALLLAGGATALGGAVFLLEPGMAAGLALVALLLMAAEEGPPGRLDRLLVPGALFVALAALATWRGHSLLAALPSLTWIVALAALGMAAALDRGDERAWRDLLGTLVVAALVVAACGAALTLWLGREVDPASALATRLVLFRQHPNFLAPFYGVHAVLAAGLALRRSPWSLAWGAAALLLAAAALHTDSRTGVAAMFAGLALLPALWGLAALLRRVPGRVVLALALALPLAGATAFWAAGGASAAGRVTAGIDRFAKSMEFRVDAWNNSLAIIGQHPWLGIGPHTFIAVERFRPGSRFYNEPEAPHPHNMPLYVAQSAGLPALALVTLWIGWLLARAFAAFRRGDRVLPAALPAAAMAAAVSAVLASLFDLGLSLETVVPAPLWLFTGLLAAGPCAAPVAARATRPASALLWTLAGLLLLLNFAVRPVRAQALALQAQLLAWEGQQAGQPALQAEAREVMARALAIHAPTPRGHDLLARWLEQAGDTAGARAVLDRLVELAPRDAASHSLLGRFLMRHGDWAGAAAALGRALEDIHGSQQENRDRADRIACLLRLGRREEALAALVDALRIDSGVIALLPWQDAAAGRFLLTVHGTPAPPPIALPEAVEIAFARRVAEHAAGQPDDRRSWMDIQRAFRVARRDDRALEVLDWIERNVAPEVVEPSALASERGSMALEAGRLDEARAAFERAFELSGNPFFRHRVAEVQRRLGEDTGIAELGQEVLQATGEILDQPTAFHDNLLSQYRTLLAQAQPGDAADVLLRTLLFEDDLLARARVLLEAGTLLRQADRHAEALAALREAARHLAAKAFPWQALQEDLAETLPGRVAAELVRTWRAQGLSRDERQRAAWGLPDWFSSRQGPSLLRLAFHRLNAQPDQLLRESELQLLADRRHLPALWARLFALEAAGRHLELADAMRALVEEYRQESPANAQYDQQVALMAGRLADPQAWRRLALLALLTGRYAEAVDFLGRARALLPDDPEAEAEVCSWQALAAFVAGRAGEARRILSEAAALRPEDELTRLRLSVIPDEVPR